MQFVTQRLGQYITIGDVKIVLTEVQGKHIRLGIEVGKEMPIYEDKGKAEIGYIPISSLHGYKRLLEAVYSGSAELHYQFAVLCQERQHYDQAERWLRYADLSGHNESTKDLIEGIQEGYFLDTRQRVCMFSIQILESLITPCPNQQEIDGLENIIMDYLNKKYEGFSNS
jgi:hypothetical protein